MQSKSSGPRAIVFSAMVMLFVTACVHSTTGRIEPTQGGLTAFSINDGAGSTASRTVTLNNAGTNAPTEFMASESAAFTGAAWQAYAADPSFQLSSGGGAKTVYLKTRNANGLSNVMSDTITLNEQLGAKEETVLLPGDVPLVLVWCPAGMFMMGRSPDEGDKNVAEVPRHPVTFAQGYWMGKCELTKAQWRAVVGTEPWLGKDRVIEDPNSPAVYVSWEDAKRFIAALNTHVANTGQGEPTLRLPSEAEWEYAARAGTSTPFFWEGDPISFEMNGHAWQYENALNAGETYAHVVGLKRPNAWGLYDTSGNVSEWCEDDWNPDYSGAPPDGRAWTNWPGESFRVARGGSWGTSGIFCRSAAREYYGPSVAGDTLGFRLAR